MGSVIWLKFGLVRLFGGRFMLKKFHGNWDHLTCTCFTMPLCCIHTLGIYCGCLDKQLVVKFGGDQSYDPRRLHKKFYQQWIKENGTPFTKLHSAPTDKMNFSRRKIHLGYGMFLEKLARYGIKVMEELFGNLWSNINGGCFTNLK